MVLFCGFAAMDKVLLGGFTAADIILFDRVAVAEIVLSGGCAAEFLTCSGKGQGGKSIIGTAVMSDKQRSKRHRDDRTGYGRNTTNVFSSQTKCLLLKYR